MSPKELLAIVNRPVKSKFRHKDLLKDYNSKLWLNGAFNKIDYQLMAHKLGAILTQDMDEFTFTKGNRSIGITADTSRHKMKLESQDLKIHRDKDGHFQIRLPCNEWSESMSTPLNTYDMRGEIESTIAKGLGVKLGKKGEKK